MAVKPTMHYTNGPYGCDMRPLAHADGCDCGGLDCEPVPGVAGGIGDIGISVEDAIREPVGAQVLPDVLDRIQLWRAGG